MSLWFVAFQGSTPIGGPLIGWVMGVLGARAGLGIGAVTCIVVAIGGLAALRSRPSGGRPVLGGASRGAHPTPRTGTEQSTAVT
jgi:hypothetical protein